MESTTPRLDDLAAFLSVAEAGGFSAAAQQTGRPLSTISRRVAALESGLGEPLIRRGGRGFALTARGTALFADAREAIQTAKFALEGAPNKPLSGPLRVSCAAYTARNVIRSALLAFVRDHPDMTLDLVLTNASLDLTEHGIDVAIRSGPLPDGALRARKLRETAFAVFSGEPGPPLNPDALSRAPAVTTPPLLDWTFVDMRGRAVRVRPRSVLSVGDLDIAAEAARDGIGLAYLPEELGFSHGLIARDIHPLAPFARPLFAVWPSAPVRAPKVDAFVTALLSG